jgi:L-rhamnose isomerase
LPRLPDFLLQFLTQHHLPRQAEADGDFTTRRVLLEEARILPLGAVWQEYCRRQNVPGDSAWIAEVKNYKKTFLSKRN